MSFLSGLVNSVMSNLIHPSHAGETDGTEPPRSPTSSHPQTGPSAAAVDLTGDSAPPRAKRPAPSHADSRPEQVRVPKKPRLSDEQRLVPGRYPRPHGATPVPDPYTNRPSTRSFGFQPSTMSKPGAQHSFQPLGNRILPKSPKVYTRKGQSTARYPGSYSRYFDDSNELPPSPYEPPLDSTHPMKRRKIEVNIVDDEDDDGDESRASHHQSSPPVTHPSPTHTSHPHSSRRSVGSNHNVGALFSFQSPNEYEDLVKATIPRRKAARGPVKHQNGHHASPIVLDEDTAQPSTARKLQLNAFGQGKPAQTSSSGRVPRINQSTEPPRGEPEQPARESRHAGILRDMFRKTTDCIADDEADELAPTSVTSKQHRPRPTAARSKAGHPEWPLQFARIHGYDWTSRSPVLRAGDTEDIWRIVAEDENGKEILLHEIKSTHVNKACGDDTRIRLEGPQRFDNIQKYLCDLQFVHRAHCQAFKTVISNITTEQKVRYKETKWMDRIFGIETAPAASSRPDTDPRALQSQAENGDRETQRPQSMTDIKGKASVGDGNGSGRKSTRPTRSTRAHSPHYIDVEEKPPKSKYSVDVGLGAPWKRQLTYGSGRRRAVIDFQDLTRLDEEEYLNDQLIDFYMIYLFNHCNVPKGLVYFFNCHFFATLTRNRGPINYAGVARWTAKEDLFNYDYIVIPICQDFHWFLAIICNVRNIARKPVIETVGESPSPESKTPNKSTNSHVVSKAEVSSEAEHLANGEGVSAAPPPPNSEQIPSDEGEEASLLDPVDPDAASERPVQSSPATEAANTKKLSSAEAVPQDDVSLLASKKAKRKPGPKKVDPDEPIIIVLDSLGGVPKSAAVRALKDYIQAEGREKRGMDAVIKQNAYYVKSNQIPMQQNLSDCGVYLLGYTEKFFKDPDGFKNRILQGQMQAAEDWPDMSIPLMRKTMRDLLIHLHKEQNGELRRATAKKKSIESGSHAPTAQRNATSAEKEGSSAEGTSNTTTHMGPVDSAPHVFKSPAAKQLPATVESAPKVQQTISNDSASPNSRLGSASAPQLEEKCSSPSALSDRRSSAKNSQSPKPLGEEAVQESRPAQSCTSHRVSGRRSSPQVVITSSPTMEKGKRRSEDPMLPVGFGRNLLGPKKQKTKHTHRQHQSGSDSLDSGNSITVLPDDKAEGRKHQKEANGERLAAPVGRSPRRRREFITDHGKADDTVVELDVVSPNGERRQNRKAKDMITKELVDSAKPSTFAETVKPRPFSVTSMTVEAPKNATMQATPVKPAPTYTRGSSTDPIQIDDSQEAAVASSAKTLNRKPTTKSQNSFTIESPKHLSKQAIDAFPRPFEYKNRSKSSDLAGKITLSIVDKLDSHLKRAQDTELSGQGRTDDEVGERAGFSPTIDLDDDDDDDNEITISESPPSRTRSPIDNGL